MGTARPVVALTKPAEQQAAWRSALTQAGWQVRSLPLLRLEPLPESPATRAVWPRLDEFRGIICVSPYAAGLLADRLDTWWPQVPTGMHWLTPGAGSAAALLEAFPDMPVHWPASGTTGEDLLSCITPQVQSGDHWLIIAGRGGRTILQKGLQALGAQVTRVELYARHPLPVPPDTERKLAAERAIIHVSSMTALTHLTSRTTAITKQKTTLLVSSQRLMAASQDWLHRFAAPGASLPDTVSALESLADQHRTHSHGEP